jgi:prevent-host-death family protein
MDPKNSIPRRRATTLLDAIETVELGGEPLVIERKGTPVAVLIGYDEWLAIVERVRGA